MAHVIRLLSRLERYTNQCQLPSHSVYLFARFCSLSLKPAISISFTCHWHFAHLIAITQHRYNLPLTGEIAHIALSISHRITSHVTSEEFFPFICIFHSSSAFNQLSSLTASLHALFLYKYVLHSSRLVSHFVTSNPLIPVSIK